MLTPEREAEIRTAWQSKVIPDWRSPIGFRAQHDLCDLLAEIDRLRAENKALRMEAADVLEDVLDIAEALSHGGGYVAFTRAKAALARWREATS